MRILWPAPLIREVTTAFIMLLGMKFGMLSRNIGILCIRITIEKVLEKVKKVLDK